MEKEKAQLPLIDLLLFAVLIGVVICAFIMAYEAAFEYRDMRRTCREYGLMYTEDKELVEIPQPRKPYYIPTIIEQNTSENVE